MRKPILPRLAFTIVVYVFVFAVIILVQFMKHDGFSRQIGSLIVSGKFKSGEKNDNENNPIEGPASVFFGGLEFCINGNPEQPNGLSYIDFDKIKRPLVPLSIRILERSVTFKFLSGTELGFYVQSGTNSDELIISGSFSKDVVSIDLPYKLTKSARIGSKSNSDIVVLLNKREYTFDRRILDTDRDFITLSQTDPVVAYRIVPEDDAFSPVEFIVSGAMQKDRYKELITTWSNNAYSGWNERISISNNESLINAYIAESMRKGGYPVSKISRDFVNGNIHTYLSAPYIGQVNYALRSLVSAEHEKLDAIEASLKNNTILLGEDYFEFLAQHSRNNLFDAGVDYIKTISPSSVTSNMCVAIFRGWWAYNRWYKNKENPFEVLANQACSLVSDSLKKDKENLHVFYTEKGSINVMFNIKLGAAMIAYGEAQGNNGWAAIGRSIILSAISFTDSTSSSVPAVLTIDSNGNFSKENAQQRIALYDIYPILEISDFYPHTVGAGSVMFDVWLWTASPSIAAAYRNNILEFDVEFPVSETHYLMIRGIKPFSKIQMRGIDYRSDPQFERYDSPGWVYSPSEQALLIKMVHRSEHEIIKIFY
jgi:hypothetical protein